MAGPHPSTAAIRYAVRSVLVDVEPGAVVLVACSGGGDSMALAEAVAHERHAGGRSAGRSGERSPGWSAVAVVVDHGLVEGSDAVAGETAQQLRDRGFDSVEVVEVAVDRAGGAGVEAAARDARYGALDAAADRLGAAVVLLGHTLNDQAEQVMLGLMRGSGARSLAGMPAVRGVYRRPLLAITRVQCRESLQAEGWSWWDDPMNDDDAFARVRVRRALADLESDLGPGIAAALARSADQLRDDADYLDAVAAAVVDGLGPGPWPVSDFEAMPRAVRTRAWRKLLIAAGAPSGQVSTRHTDASDALIVNWRGQGAISVPGPLLVTRADGLIHITRA